jgi:hypothetical protein
MLLNGGGGDWNSGLALDRSGNFYIGGTYRFNSPAPPFMVGSYSVPTYGLKAGFFMAKFQYDTSTCYSTPVLPAATATVVNDEVAVYPNPVDEVLYLNGLKEDYAYRLITIAGATVLSGKLRSGNSILCQTLPTGIYLLELTTADQQKTYRKIIKR